LILGHKLVEAAGIEPAVGKKRVIMSDNYDPFFQAGIKLVKIRRMRWME